MERRSYTAEQIIRMLREAEVELAKGQNVGAVCKELGVTSNTYYRWRKEETALLRLRIKLAHRARIAAD